MKVRRLNESDIQRIVKRVLNEQLSPTYQNPLCNDMTGTYGTGTKTKFKVCVYKMGPLYTIDLRDSNDKVLMSPGGGETMEKATQVFYAGVDKKYPGKTLGIDFPIPIDPDNPSVTKYYKLGD
jgi:hypothetical protein